MNSIYPFFRWVDSTRVNQWINDSLWLFPAIEAVHIVALAVLIGAVLMLNLRVLGVALKAVPVPRLARELAPWTLVSLILILISGALLFASEAVRSFHSNPFRIKMVFLAAAIVFHYTASRKLTLMDEGRIHPIVSKLAAVVGIFLWVAVGFAGRAIGFF